MSVYTENLLHNHRERIMGLPKWAQFIIGHLRMRLTELEQMVKEGKLPVTEESDIVVNPYAGSYAFTLIKHTRIMFKDALGYKYYVRFADDAEKGGLEIYCESRCAVHPRATNVLIVKGDKW